MEKFTKTSYLKSNEMLLIMKKNLAPDNSFSYDDFLAINAKSHSKAKY